MDKLLFFFRRKDGLTRQEFRDHYLEVHAPLGMRVTVTMAGYTVNLVDSESPFDAVTEIWTASMADFFDPTKSFANEDDAKTLMADHDSFIGPYDAYAVEESIVQGAVPDAPLGELSGAAKVIVRYADAADVPPAPSDAVCVIDQQVVQSFMPGSPPLALVRSIWSAQGTGLSAFGDDALLVSEVRQMLPAG
jgi:EthD domain